ncbi:hypothetical protein Micbo1qcDRAFT_212684 [Microdochium bolleyi]|uniref:Uncharacterized protein n=1 Tax=Microdochium bolleyi TaxID=196109 RepID=A0A136IWN5_9PEZI|nr:hypothetical protein Micbo1qcDRAFT_212684 [Microdochium bolleyi]
MASSMSHKDPAGPPPQGLKEDTTNTYTVSSLIDAATEVLPHDKATHLAEKPTLSHALAMEEQDEMGHAQVPHDDEVANLGWNEPKEDIPKPLVGGIDNEELWLLTRRFNKQIYHVKEVPTSVPGNLDLNIADEEEFSPDKLRAHIERLYMTVIIGVLGAVKQIVRLRSWRETRRTSGFCAAYFVAWALDLITPLLLATVITLVAYPPSREYLFPPAPLALVDSKTGGVQKPKAGVLASHDSATGAPENHKGEAVEKEASNFFNTFASVALSSATGKHPQGDPDADDKAPGSDVPDPTSIATGAADAKEAASGGQPHPSKDKTKVPMETAVWNKMRPTMRALADTADTWERFANALSPTPPFPENTVRVRLAGILAPLLLVSLFTSSYMFTKGATFGVGFGFFGDPIISRGLALLNRKFPNWQKLLELRNTVLKGVPTNAQLTLTLLRIGEVNKAPLPPPPRVTEGPPDRPAEITDAELRATGAEPPLNASAAEIEEAMAHDPTVAHETAGDDIDAAKDKKHGRKGSKIVNFFKNTTKGAVKTVIGADHIRAKTGSHHAKDRLGVVPAPHKDLTSGPVDFLCRYKGQKGHVYISSKATIPCVAFSTDSTIEKIGSVDREDLHPLWSIPIGDIAGLKKLGGYGWKAKLVVGWALGSEVNDGLEIEDRQGALWRVTAVPLRDELFNRLIAMGGQKWEAW